MAENFSVKLEEAKYYTPEASCKEHSWIGDYNRTYQEFLANPDLFWDSVARELETQHHPQLPGPPRPQPAAQQGRDHVAG